MGILGVTGTTEQLLLAVLAVLGVVAIVAGVALLAGPAWALIAGGVFAIAVAVLLYDPPKASR